MPKPTRARRSHQSERWPFPTWNKPGRPCSAALTSNSGQRTYDHAIREFVAWHCSEPRLAFNRTVVLRYRIPLEQRQYAPATINLRLAAVRPIAYEAADAGLMSPGWPPAVAVSKACGAWAFGLGTG